MEGKNQVWRKLPDGSMELVEEEILDIPSTDYMITGNEENIANLSFRKPNIVGLHEKPTMDSKGDIVLIEMYKSYNSETGVFSDLAVKEERVYERNALGIVSKRTTDITWYMTDGLEGYKKENLLKYYDGEEGLTQNQKSRSNLCNRAGLWLAQDLMLQYGAEIGETKAKEFLDSVSNDSNSYKNAISIVPLVTAVNNTTYDYMLEDSIGVPEVSRKDVFNSIINISYP